MDSRDGIYIENELVATAEGIVVNFQGNDLTKPASQQTSYSESFDLPDSLAVRKLTQHAEQLDSASRFAYKPLAAKVINNGETIFTGIAELSSWSNGWEVALYEEKRALFDRLDRSLRTLDLSRYDHPWTLEQINLHANVTDGVCYPLIDYGLLSNNIMPLDTVFPAVFVKTLVAQMLSEEGYTLIGDVLSDDLFQRLIVPFSEDEPTNHDDQWRADRYARVSLNFDPDTINRSTLGKGQFLDRIQPYDIDNTDTLYQGKLHPFNTTTHEYICPEAMNLHIQVSQFFKVFCLAGGVEVILSVEVNGNQVVNNRFEVGAGYNLLFLRVDHLTLAQTIKCKAGDRVAIRLEARRFTNLGAFRFEIYNDPDNSFVEFNPNLSLSFGDMWPVARNIVDLTCVQLMIALGYIMDGTWVVNVRKKQVSFSSFSKIVGNTTNAVDWSDRLDTGSDAKWSPRLAPYAQTNYLTWKENAETKAAGKLLDGGKMLNYGDGVIRVDAPVLETDATLFEMPFGASTDSDKDLPGYGSPVLIKTRTVSGTGSNITINNQNTTARLLLASLGDAFDVASTKLDDDGQTIIPVTLNLKPCWFGQRPYPLLTTNPAFTLSYDKLLLSRGELALIDHYFGGLIRVLRRMRVLTVSMRLKPTDIANLDFGKPIRLKRTSIAGLVISDGFYYLNKVGSYESGRTCSVTLVAF